MTDKSPADTPRITRRNVIQGVIVPIMANAMPPRAQAAAPDAVPPKGTAASYPPLRTGLRGQYPGSFEAAHAARDGLFAGPVTATDTGEHYDLVVVGAGISGLSAALFYQRAMGPDARILIIDNHDDFGGHAKRNEFHYGGQTYLGYGGTMSIETPFPYSYTATSLLMDLGIRPDSYSGYLKTSRLKGLEPAVFYDRETFGRDQLVPGYHDGNWARFFHDSPLDDQTRADLLRLHTQAINYLPDMTPDARQALLRTISYETFLRRYAHMSDGAIRFFAGKAYRNNMRVDTCPAYDAMKAEAPGFNGMEVTHETPHESAVFHFPDGNATTARLLVGRLVPSFFGTPQTAAGVIMAQGNYARLDRPGPVRIRLNGMVVRVEHTGDPARPNDNRPVRVVYQKPDGTADTRHAVMADNVIMACFNNIIPFIVPSLPDAQKDALKYPSKVPMQYSTVLLRNGQALRRCAARSIYAPCSYHTRLLVDEPVDIGGYTTNPAPDRPTMIHLLRNANAPGRPRKEQNRLGRQEMLAMTFPEIEAKTRDQLQRMFGSLGFNHEHDIVGLTVNRWPHGYAYTYDTLGDPYMPAALRPHVIGRQPYGRIAIANADSTAAAFTNTAIDAAERAVQECLISRGYT
ncbi:NAD(P)/FAD-dependent oxidoreductase [Komagataeibacter europaeus]|uniref:NAD(P)/FAD-dependent oxidoreductase n=1 Tax=Komagataeibacter europaeus TaxID=33995 RepID=UPI000475329E|nr:NAD(P)/FAD-dependent oxidoreductase [Komagataeibacter europaeus]GBQ43253.1 hypothetical protein AA18890_1849 [Komagataeibacter europaeus LMG 18890]